MDRRQPSFQVPLNRNLTRPSFDKPCRPTGHTADDGIEADVDMLKYVDLWRVEASRAGVGEGWREVVCESDMQRRWGSGKERTREKERRARIESNFDELISCSPVRKAEKHESSKEPPLERKKRIRKDKEITVILQDKDNHDTDFKRGIKKPYKGLNKISKEKMANLIRLTRGNSDFKTTNSNTTMPNLDMIILKVDENKESLSKHFEVLENLGEG